MPPSVPGAFDRAVEVLCDLGTPHNRWSVGSGYLVGGRLVLTCAHVVDGSLTPGTVSIRTVEGTEYSAAVARVARDGEPDLALLTVTDARFDQGPPPVVFGAIDRGDPREVHGCWALGFPGYRQQNTRALLRGQTSRQTGQVSGYVLPGTFLRGPTGIGQQCELTVTNAPAMDHLRGGAESPWAGMSGALVFVENGGGDERRAIGVVTQHKPGAGAGALVVTLATAIGELAEAAGWARDLGIDDLAALRPAVLGQARPTGGAASGNGDGGSGEGTMTDGFTIKEIHTLADVFYRPASAGHLLESAGLRPNRHPIEQPDALEYWKAVNRLVVAGLLPDGRREIFRKALELFPDNPVFRNGLARPPLPQDDAGPDPPEPPPTVASVALPGLPANGSAAADAPAAVDPTPPPGDTTWDFLVAVAARDEPFGDWVAFHLRDNGYTVRYLPEEQLPGGLVAGDLHEAIGRSRRVILVLSDAYPAEVERAWQAALNRGLTGQGPRAARPLVPVRVDDSQATGLLADIRPIDLRGLGPDEARARFAVDIEAVVTGRRRTPSQPPAWPGS